MSIEEQNSIFTLLYAVVLIDNHIAKVELDVFHAIVQEFLETAKYHDKYSAQATLVTWFVANYKSVLKAVGSPQRDIYLFEHAVKLKHYKFRGVVFDMMKKIAFADAEYHEKERIFLGEVSTIWGLD